MGANFKSKTSTKKKKKKKKNVLLDAAHDFGAHAFVMVSTDKAVNPTIDHGRLEAGRGDLHPGALGRRAPRSSSTVRFGNVLGSAGSVIPIFREQIAKGGPVTVTHPEMTRYFMTIPEACQLVLQAGAMGQGGEIFVLDMGEPVKIVDLARDLIRSRALGRTTTSRSSSPAMRPGEKLFEELLRRRGDVDKTPHPKIHADRGAGGAATEHPGDRGLFQTDLGSNKRIIAEQTFVAKEDRV